MADAYLKSLQLDGVEVFSSGTVAQSFIDTNVPVSPLALDVIAKDGRGVFAKHTRHQLLKDDLREDDITVCVNQRVADDFTSIHMKLPKNVIIWDVADIDEPGRIPKKPEDYDRLFHDIYYEITTNVDELVKSFQN